MRAVRQPPASIVSVVLAPASVNALASPTTPDRTPRRGPLPRYSRIFRFYLSDAMYAELEAEADAGETAVAAVVRDAIERGLPLVRADRRKRERADRAEATAARGIVIGDGRRAR